MPLPMGVNVVTVTGTFTDAAGNGQSGTVTFTPSNELADTGGLVVVTTRPIVCTVANGTFTSPPLAATDNTSLSPSGWSYQVAVTLGGVLADEFTCILPSSPSTVDMTALIQVTPATPVTPYLTIRGGTIWGPLTLGGSPPLRIATGAAAGDVFTSSDSSGNGAWAPPAAATSSVPGAIELTADLGGSATAPHVVHTNLALPLPLAQGGTGSAAQNFSGLLTQTSLKTGAYTAAPGDFVTVDTTSAGVTVTLPSAPANLAIIGVKMSASATAANPVTVNCSGSDVFDKTGGSASSTLYLMGQSAVWQYQSSTGIWLKQGDNLPLAQLDTHYTAMLANEPIIPSISGAIRYTGSWTQATGNTTHNAAGVSAYSNSTGATATCTFTGTGIRIWGNLNPGHGQASVTIDGGSPVTVDTYAASNAWGLIYATAALAYGTHTLVITILGTKNVSSTGTRVQFDSLVPVNQHAHLPGTVFNVMDPFFGAVGDGVTDDTLAIQAAVNAALAASGAVYFPGTANWYHTTAPITASSASSLTLFGDGYRSCIKSSGNYDVFQLTSLGGVTITSIRLDTEVATPTGGYGFNLTSCSNMYFLWVMTADVYYGLHTVGSDTITMFGCFFHGYYAGGYTQNAIHASGSQFGGGVYGIILDSTSGSCSFMSCAYFGPLSLVTWNTNLVTNPNKGLTFINSGSNYEAGIATPAEGNGGIDLNYCAGNVILDGCYNAGSGLRFGLNVTTFDTLHIVGGEYGGSGSSQADGIVMSKGSHITIHGAKLGGTANTSSDIISIASGADSVIISGNHFIGTCNYAVNSAATGAGTGEIIIRDNDFTGITSSPNLSAGTYVNVPPGNYSSYSIGGNTSGVVTTRATRVGTLAAVSGVYTPSRDTMDEAVITSPAAAFTIAAPTGTAVDGDKLILRIRSGTAYTPTWTTTSGGYEGSPGLALPSTVTASAVDYFGFKYNLTSARWLLVAYMPGFA